MTKVETKKMYVVVNRCFDNYNDAVIYAGKYGINRNEIKVENCEVYKLNPFERIGKKIKNELSFISIA